MKTVNGIYFKPVTKVQGEIELPGDKSISHRAALFGGMATGETHITNFLLGEDCLSMLGCLAGLGVEWEQQGTEFWLHSKGMDAWQEPVDILDVGNSGTAIRLLMGALAGSPFTTTFSGDASIRQRPMRRVADPLRAMGAEIMGRQDGNFAPLTLRGGNLRGQSFETPVASAQVKSAILLAGLRAEGETVVKEPALSRDHTERLLRGFGVKVISEGTTVKVSGGARLTGQEVAVPGDVSSAAFFLVLGSLAQDGEIIISNVGTNPTRTGIIDALRLMGACIEELNVSEVCGEPRATLRVTPTKLCGIEIGGEIIPRIIDELPILAVAASLAEGETVIRDAAELRVKETDRISTVVNGLRALGAKIEEMPDGFRIQGQPSLRGGSANSHGDHRLAMAWAIAGLLSEEGVSVEGMDAAAVSFPNFLDMVKQITVV